jgi:prepilin-type N-terminal cleavage/methylation domain-containing protein
VLHNTRNAFTLLEVLMVVALLAVVAAIAWPDFGQARRSEELDESARRIRTAVQMCRARAMNECRRYRLAFREDGTLWLTRQRDPLLAPHEYFRFRDPWASVPLLLEHVWVESLLPLPEGPPPMELEDELLEFDQFDDEPIPITDFEREYLLNFEPDGVSNSLRWILRDQDGRGLEMTLDGRLGRVRVELAERLTDEPERPAPLDYDEDEEFEEDQPELEERR